MATIKTVVQATSKTTTVVANYKNCIIQTVALTDAADTSFEFLVTNDKLYPQQNVQLTAFYAGTTGIPHVFITEQTQGSFKVKVVNVGTAVLNAAVKINASVINC
jgi:hypothetical protein